MLARPRPRFRKLSAFRVVIGLCAIFSTLGIYALIASVELGAQALALMAINAPVPDAQRGRGPRLGQTTPASMPHGRALIVDEPEAAPKPPARFTTTEVDSGDGWSIVVVADHEAKVLAYVLIGKEGNPVSVGTIVPPRASEEECEITGTYELPEDDAPRVARR